MKILSTMLTITLTMIALSASAQQGPQGRDQRAGSCGQLVADYFGGLEVVALSAAEEAAVKDLREEEKLARDVYLTLAERWQLPVFANIARSEQAHMDHVAQLFEVYDVIDPVTDDTVGAFTSAEYTLLYEELVARGEAFLESGLDVGATIEDLDLADLEALLDLSDNPHVGFVAHNLAKGSRNHLRAFVGALTAQGETYSAQYLSQETIDEILAAPAERKIVYDADGGVLATCGGGGRGRGWGGDQGSRGCDGNGGGSGGGRGTGECGGSGRNGGGGGNGDCDGSGPGGN